MTALSQAPVLSTPETHLFEDPTLVSLASKLKKKTEQEIWEIYEVERTAREIVQGGWRKVALQFPDRMVGEGVGVYEALERELGRLNTEGAGMKPKEKDKLDRESLETDVVALSISNENSTAKEQRIRLYILADTSYGSCCVDEIAAEHVDADVVVHYGRACLSPTARLPVIYVFTKQEVDITSVVGEFKKIFSEKEEKVVLMADVTAHEHIPLIAEQLRQKGYGNILAPEVIHDPSSSIPNRKVPEGVELANYALFHIADPPPALLLTLHSRVREMYIYSPDTRSSTRAETSLPLRRRYAVLTSLSTCGVFGILINTLSVSSFLPTLKTIQDMIRAKRKKYYTFVVGKLNPEKIANFAEIEGWVVVGCWESGLVDMKGERGGYWRGMITPWELECLFKGDDGRVWDGRWRGDFEGLEGVGGGIVDESGETTTNSAEDDQRETNSDSESESEPPEFDLRTGRYVSHSRPMKTTASPISTPTASSSTPTSASNVLTRRAKGELATVNGTASPGAEYLNTKRTWMGLGSDFQSEEEEGRVGTAIEEGRRGVARGYVVGDGEGEDGEGEDGERR